MYAVGIMQKDGNVALSINGQWAYKALRNPEDIPVNFHTEVGFFRYHQNSGECFWIDPKIIIERAIIST